MRFSVYALASTALVAAVAYQAYEARRQFYPTMIYLTTNKLSLLALGNEALMLTLLVGQLVKTLFFGRLREAEVEHLYERSWYAITETCLAMTIFREEFNVSFVALFTALLFLKLFHWLMQALHPCTPCSPCSPCSPCTPLPQALPLADAGADRVHGADARRAAAHPLPHAPPHGAPLQR